MAINLQLSRNNPGQAFFRFEDICFLCHDREDAQRHGLATSSQVVCYVVAMPFDCELADENFAKLLSDPNAIMVEVNHG